MKSHPPRIPLGYATAAPFSRKACATYHRARCGIGRPDITACHGLPYCCCACCVVATLAHGPMNGLAGRSTAWVFMHRLAERTVSTTCGGGG